MTAAPRSQPSQSPALADVRRLGEFLVAEFLGPEWSFEFDHAKSRAGKCDYTNRRISVSRYLVARNSQTFARDTVIHEVAHGIAGPAAGHGPEWRRVVVELGGDPARTHQGEVAREFARWQGVCPNGHEVLRFRRPKRARMSCAQCSRSFDERFLIAWRERTPAELAAERER